MDILGIKKIDFIKADFHDDKIIIALNTDESSYLILFTKNGLVSWKNRFSDRYLLNCEFDKTGKYFLVHSSKRIYCFRNIDTLP